MRKAFADALVKLADNDPKVIFLTGDLGFGVFDEFKEKFKDRYVNVGIAEAHMMNMAAGLAFEGWRPITYSIASFATGRPFEQIRVSIGYPGLPVIVVGAGGGYTYSSSGVTHHAGEDIALMSLIPNMTVVVPGDKHEVEQLLPQLVKLNGPSYLRIGKYGEPSYECPEVSEIGKVRHLREGKHIAIASTGNVACMALDAADLLKTQGIYPAIYHFHTVKPIDTEALELLTNQYQAVLVVEEHVPRGGLWSEIAGWMVANNKNHSILLRRLGPDGNFVFGTPKQDTLKRNFGYDSQGIAFACKEISDQLK